MRDSVLTNSTASVDLVLQYQFGNEKALERLWSRYLPRLRRWAHGRLPPGGRGGTDTEDLVQDAFVRSLAHLRTLKPAGRQSVFAYMKTVVLNQVRDHLRQLSRRPMSDLADVAEPLDRAPSPLEQTIGREDLERYEQALASLHADDQDLVLAVVELGLTDHDIAAWFEKPSVDAARMARGRALARLARAMEAGRAPGTASSSSRPPV